MTWLIIAEIAFTALISFTFVGFGALAAHGLRQLAADAGPAVPVTLAEIGGP